MKTVEYAYENFTQAVKFDSEEDVLNYTDGKKYYFESDGGYNGF